MQERMPNCALRRALPVASGQQVPLHHVLVGPEGLQEVEDPSHEQEPEVVLDQAGFPVAQAELAPFPGGGDDLAGVLPPQNQGAAEHASPHQQDPLQEIGPDHALNAARQGVGHGQEAHHQDHPPHVPPGDEGQGQPQEVDGQAHVQDPAQDERDGGISLGRIPETGSQVLVGAHSKRAAVEDHEPPQRQKHHQRQAQVIGEGPHVAEKDVPGMAHEGGAAHHRSHKGEPHHPAGQVASGQEVVLRRFLAPGEVEGQAADKRQVDDQDRDVEWAHSASRMDCRISRVRPRRCALRLMSNMMSLSDFFEAAASRKCKLMSKSSLRRSSSEAER